MKKLIILLLLLVSGCVSVKYNPETQEVIYQRFGDQELGGVEIVLPDGSYVTFESQKSDARIIKDTLDTMIRFYNLGAGK